MTDEKQAVPEDQKTIDKMTVKELREVAKECEITGTSTMKKDELLTAIKDAKGESPEENQLKTTPAAAPKAVKKKSAVKRPPVTTTKECKSLIAELRKEKETAKASGDKIETAILRKRISNLKKKSRKLIKTD